MPWAIPSEPGASQASWHCNQEPGSTQRPSEAAPPRVCRIKLKGIRLCVWAMLPSNGMLVAIAQPMPAWTPPWSQMIHLLSPEAPNPTERHQKGVHDNHLLTISVLGLLQYIVRCLVQPAKPCILTVQALALWPQPHSLSQPAGPLASH